MIRFLDRKGEGAMRCSRGLAVLVLACALSVAAGCERIEDWRSGDPAAGTDVKAAAPVFVYAADMDLSGYYPPVEQAGVGRWRLDHLFLGQEADFQAWTEGRREGVFAPLMLEFVDPQSPLVQTELGQVRSGRVRVLPDRFEVSGDRIVFAGQAEGLGVVSFEGRLDLDALATARRALGDARVVLTGTLTADGRAVPVSFRWWAGD